jgi:hypothetical protein
MKTLPITLRTVSEANRHRMFDAATCLFNHVRRSTGVQRVDKRMAVLKGH